MGVCEQQNCIDQVTLLRSKLNHLEETLKIEEQEKQWKQKLDTQLIESSRREAEVLARKEQERASEEILLQEEEGARKKLLNKMVSDADRSLEPVTKLLVNLEGKYYCAFNYNGNISFKGIIYLRTLLNFYSIKIRSTTFLNYVKFADDHETIKF